jgi:uncharacterized protein YndB with AHSA1/START domain
MSFPDRVERTVELAHPPGTVWAALTTAEGLCAWFGDEAAIDLRPGGEAQLRWADGKTVDMRVEGVEQPAVFGFTLEPAGSGTRLTVVETGFAQLPDDTYRKAFDGHLEDWAREPGELTGYLDAARQ